jgi:hypothetical protein
MRLESTKIYMEQQKDEAEEGRNKRLTACPKTSLSTSMWDLLGVSALKMAGKISGSLTT